MATSGIDTPKRSIAKSISWRILAGIGYGRVKAPDYEV
jgi:hypothetical protein